MNLKLSIFNRPLELPPQLEWKFSHEPELLGWSIRARNYNTMIANGIFIFMAPIALGLTYLIYSIDAQTSLLWNITSCAIYLMILLIGLTSMTHQKMKFAYRFTHSGVEICEWKDFPQWTITFLKWFTPFIFILFLFLASIDPAFLLGALVGPGGMALTYFSILKSKSFRDLHTEYHHFDFKWSEFIQLAIASNREVVDLQYSMHVEGHDYPGIWNINIFCKPRQKEQIAEFIRPYLSPETPVIRAKVHVPMSTL